MTFSSLLKVMKSLHPYSASEPDPTPQQSPFFWLPVEIRIIIYRQVLEGIERPEFFIEGKDVWRCGPSSAFMCPGPPSILLVCRQVAEEASEVLHEVRELHFMAIPKGLATQPISCYYRFGSVEAFVPVLRRIQRLSLAVNTHAGQNDELFGMALLNLICSVLENRPTPPRGLRLSFNCCFSTSRVRCQDNVYYIAERFRLLGPIFIEHLPWNGKCTWANVYDSRARSPSLMFPNPLTEEEALSRYLSTIENDVYPGNDVSSKRDRRMSWTGTAWASLAFCGLGKLAATLSRRQS